MAVRTTRAGSVSALILVATLCGCGSGEPSAPVAPPAPSAQDTTAAPADSANSSIDCQGSYSQSGALVDTSAPLRGNIVLHIRGQANNVTVESIRNGTSDGPPAAATNSNGLNAVFRNKVTVKNLTLGSLMSGNLIVPNAGAAVTYLINGFCGPSAF